MGVLQVRNDFQCRQVPNAQSDDFGIKIVSHPVCRPWAIDTPSRLSCLPSTTGHPGAVVNRPQQQLSATSTHYARTLLKANSGWRRTLRNALVALLSLIGCVQGIRAAMTRVLDRLPSTLELFGVSLLLGMLASLSMRWHQTRRNQVRRVEIKSAGAVADKNGCCAAVAAGRLLRANSH